MTVEDCDRNAFRERVRPLWDTFTKQTPGRSRSWTRRCGSKRPEPRHGRRSARVDAFAGAEPRADLRPAHLPARCCAWSRRSAGLLLVADLLVVSASVLSRYVLEAPLVWSDDVARALLLGVSFLGAAAALARGENAGVAFFADRLPPATRRFVDAIVARR